MSSGLALPVLAQRVDKRDTPKEDAEPVREDVRDRAGVAHAGDAMAQPPWGS